MKHRFLWGKTIKYDGSDLVAEYPELLRKLSGLLYKATPQHVSLQGLPGTGKTSAILSCLGSCVLIYVDINDVCRDGPTAFYALLETRVREGLSWDASGDTPWRTVVEALTAPETREKAPVVIVLDHFDRFLQLGTTEQQRGILAELLGIMNKCRHVALVYVSVRPLARICRHIDHMSELPERCTVVTAKGPSISALSHMLESEFATLGLQAAPGLVDRGLKLVGGNPSLTQIYGEALAQGGMQEEGILDKVRENAKGLLDRVYALHSPSEWKAFIRWQGAPGASGDSDLRLAEVIKDELIYDPQTGTFFSQVFVDYLNDRLSDGHQMVGFVSSPLALGKPEHSRFLLAACQGDVYQVNWTMVGESADPRFVYRIEPSTSSGQALRPFFLKIDLKPAVEKELRTVDSVRNSGVFTPPVSVITIPGDTRLAGLKTDIAALNPRGVIWTLREYMLSFPKYTPLYGALTGTYRALSAIYQNAQVKERTLRGSYKPYVSNLQTAIETAITNISDPFGVKFLKPSVPTVSEAMGRFARFWDHKELLTCGPAHGDLHSRNVIRDEDGNIRVIDFGRYREDVHVFGDCARLELSLLFDYVHDSKAKVEPLVLLRTLMVWADAEAGFIPKSPLESSEIEDILKASRDAILVSFQGAKFREYLSALLGTVLVLLSFPSYFTDQTRWVAYLFALHLSEQLETEVAR